MASAAPSPIRDALRYGVSFATTRSHQLAEGATACFLSGIFGLAGWFSLSLGAEEPNNLERRSLEVWLRRRRRRFATLSGTGSASPRPDRTSWLRGLRRASSPAFSGWRAGSLYP